MRAGLEATYRNYLDRVRRLKGGVETYVFESGSLPEPEAELETNSVVCKKGFHYYGETYRIEHIQFFAKPEAYRMLGFWVVSVLFGPGETSTLRLSSADSQISKLACKKQRPCPRGYSSKPHALRFSASEVAKHPWLHERCNPYELPCFALAAEQGTPMVSEEAWANRNVISGFGSNEGMARLAELWINLGCGTNARKEVDLECEGGFRGVAPHSAEVSFHLPGGDWWVLVDGHL